MRSTLTWKRMSFRDIPDVLRNCWKSLSFGNDCFFCWSNRLRTSWSVTLMFWSAASPWTHSAWMSRPSVWARRSLYSVAHCFLSAASVTLGWPCGAFGVVLRFAATHFWKSGGSGTTTAWPGTCWLDFAVMASHFSKRDLVIGWSPTSATELPGTPPPQATRTVPEMSSARSAAVMRAARVTRPARLATGGSSVRKGSVGVRPPATSGGDGRLGALGDDREQRVGGLHDGREALLRVVRDPYGELRAARLVEPAGHELAHPLGARRVELDGGHGQPALAEGDRPDAGAAELDPRLLERDEVLERLGHGAEAVLELGPELLEQRDVAGGGDPPVDVDLRLLVGDVVRGHVGIDVH